MCIILLWICISSTDGGRIYGASIHSELALGVVSFTLLAKREGQPRDQVNAVRL